MSHYFENNPNLKSDKKEIQYEYQQENFTFMLDHGVFSKSGIDIGSKVLLDVITNENLQEKILDLGCGYGTIGIILKRLFPTSLIQMVDINERALALAKENAQLNKVDVSIYQSNIYEHIVDFDFSDIITNPPIRAGKEVIYEMFLKAYEHLRDGGCLWIVIRKSHGANSAKNKIMEVFNNCEIVKKDKGFYVLKTKKNLTI